MSRDFNLETIQVGRGVALGCALPVALAVQCAATSCQRWPSENRLAHRY